MEATATRNETPITETWEEVRDLIYHICYKFQRRFGGDVEEMFGDASIVFMKVYEAYDYDRGTKFSTLLYTSVWRHLQSRHNFERRRSHIKATSLTAEDGMQIPVMDTHRHFDPAELLESLSVDAATVVKLVFEAPPELLAVAQGKGDQPRNWRSSIREYLRGAGWSADQISTAFDEVCAAIG